MADIASLGIRVTATGAKEAAADLGKLDTASQKVEKSTQAASTAMASSAKSAQQLAASAKQAVPAQTALANAHELTTARLQREQGVRERLAKLAQSNRGQRVLEASALAQQASGIGKTGAAMGAAAVSAKQLQFATRGLPAQFTDIATSLASGQRPLQVLMQQGGQVKDMFGGIGPAIKAMGGYLLGLVNPFTVSAAAAAALFFAWKQGSDEAVGFNQALALTGNIAGTTADEMQGMALAISQTTGTQHEAAKALAEVAKSGKFTADQLQEVATAALAMERATGQAVEETVKQFSKLADDPVKAVVELNEKYHLLTLAQYEHIKALQAQGREEDAVTEAIRVASAGLTKRAKDVVDNAGYMEKAWRGFGAVVRQVWDDMLNAGRASAAITQSQTAIASANSELGALAHRTRYALANGRKFTSEQVEAIRTETARLVAIKRKAAVALVNDPATKAAERDAATQKANEIAIALDQEAATFDSQIVKLGKRKVRALGDAAEAIKLAQQQGNTDLVDAIKKDAKAIGDAIDKEIAEIKAREKKKPKKKAAFVDQGQSILARIRQQIALNGEELASSEALTTSERLRVTVIEQLKDARLKTTAATRAAIDAELKALEASDKTLQSHKDEERALESLRRLTNELSTAEQNRRRQNEAELLGMGRGRLERDQALRRLAIEHEYFDEVKRLNDLAAQEKRKVSQAELDELKAFHDRALIEEEEFQRRRTEMAADWRNGARAATADYIEEAKDVASQTYDIARSFYDGLGDVITDFITKGKADWKGFFDDIARQITAMIVRAQLAKLAEKFMPGGGSDSAAALSGAATALAASAAPLIGAATALSASAAALAAAGVGSAAAGAAGDAGGSSSGWISAIASLFGGGRAAGGPVAANRIYEVGEQNRPELLQMHGRSYLIPGNNGNVVPIGGGSSQQPLALTQIFQVQGAPDRRTREQMSRASGHGARRGMARTG